MDQAATSEVERPGARIAARISRARKPLPYGANAAILHDTIEDTETSPEELENYFGRRFAFLSKK
jgi:(p)ppGpp synthase/HD superfamily hydrolase